MKPTKSQAVAVLCLGAFGGWSLGALAGCATEQAYAAPCEAHTGAAKKECRAAQAKRDRMPYPPKVTWQEALDRLTPYEESALLAIGECEMGTGPQVRAGKYGPKSGRWSRLRWGLNLPRFSTAFGIWNGNGAYITATTGYRFPEATPAEGVLNAAALARRYGFSAWACHR